MKRFLCFLVSLCFLYTGAIAECGTKEEAISILQCNIPYRHTVSDKTMEAWEKGDADAVFFMDVTEDERKNGINRWSAAVQMFQKMYFPEDPLYSETLEGRYMRDRFLAEANMIPHIFHIMPAPDETEHDEAWSMALDEVKTKYNLHFDGLTRNMSVDTHYFTPTGDLEDAFWLFHVTMENGDKYTIRVKSGEVAVCQRLEQEEQLFYMYNDLCSKKGAFFQWPLEEKAAFAEQLPDLILNAYMEGQDLGRCGDLLAIAGQGFCLPDENTIEQHQALENAVMAVGDKFHLPDGWENDAEIAFSCFRQEDKTVWRVIFWRTGNPELPGAVVDMDAETGVPFRVEKYEGHPESIPYTERL